MTSISLRSGPARVLAATALVALGTSGCAVSSPRTTHLDYDPSDGVSSDVSGVAARNLVAVAGKDGTVLSGTLVNTRDQALTVGIHAPDSEAVSQVQLKPGASVRLDEGAAVVLPPSQVRPGGVVPVVVAVLVNGHPNEAVLSVPLLPAEGIYSTVTKPAGTQTAPTTH